MSNNYNILSINPGSTSTKIAWYENEEEHFCETIDHPVDVLKTFSCVQDQLDMRVELVLKFVKDKGYAVENLDAVVGRGGMVPAVKSGAYRVNQLMVDRLKNNPVFEHASNLGAQIACTIADSVGKPSFFYDSVRVDEMHDIAKITGMPDIVRTSTSHVLNTRAMAMKVADKYGKNFEEMTFVNAHLGGGISVNVIEKGLMVDIMADDEGPFSPERAGRLPASALIEMCFSGNFDKAAIKKKQRGNAGLNAHLGTIDVREILNMIDGGDTHASLVLDAMCYQIAKGIGEMATVVNGKVDAVVITGGIAYSDYVTSQIKQRVAFIAPVEIMPGENEMESLSLGILRVLRGEEEAHEYTE